MPLPGHGSRLRTTPRRRRAARVGLLLAGDRGLELGAAVTKYLKRAYLNEQEHYQSVAGIISGSLNTPAVSGDIDFSYPAGHVRHPGVDPQVRPALESTMLGTYLGAIGGIQTNTFKTGLAQIAACEAQHAELFHRR